MCRRKRPRSRRSEEEEAESEGKRRARGAKLRARGASPSERVAGKAGSVAHASRWLGACSVAPVNQAGRVHDISNPS